ncbi:Hypothetical protein SRAE_2000274900 [Strongyloides ratti]|uniref:Uncharacterized protein n=1 Tax=Strongyloides ratti TaxID=34506 RepID=A0A090LE84_STRRB|nr:Hypothetical protein SRAE_2000274900 [Strongyloides ratti]CEF68091.1 Hypothetical protein SRAE_2000274900 [Strongyloides ratti]
MFENNGLEDIKSLKILKEDLEYCVWLMILCNDYTIDSLVRYNFCQNYYTFFNEQDILFSEHSTVKKPHTCWKYIRNYSINMDDLYVNR